ncbi:MAG: glycosyltransferase family 2 protein [Verrucomicrobiae bacterium]|nr:glycosyltransferase family 2 protein [Verrucomicrobiae bacterium]
MKVTLFIPTLNEIDGMRVIMPKIQPGWVDQILVVDGGSTDGTVDFARQQGYDVHIQTRPGIRFAYLEAWSMIKGDVVITFSPDGNCVPEVIPNLIDKMKEGYDMVVGSRYFGGMKSEDDDPMTAFGNWLFTTTINVLHGGGYTDAMGIYRIYRTNLFYELDLDREDTYVTEKLTCCVMGCEPILSVRAAKRHLKIGEVAGPEPARIGGVRKLLPFRWGGAYMLQILREVYHWC